MPQVKPKTTAKKVVTAKPAKVGGKLSVPVYSLKGEESGTLTLPEKFFGAKVNTALLSQALRIYLSNQKGHFGSTKTRAEVAGSTRKVQSQKGTGHARHGAIRAPIYVGGGIALGPKFRKIVLDLPLKMRQAALRSALSSKHLAGEVVAVEGLEKVSGKTQEMAKWLLRVGKKEALLVVGEKNAKLFQATRNLPNLNAAFVDQLNTLEVITAQTLIFTKEAVERLEKKSQPKTEAEPQSKEKD